MNPMEVLAQRPQIALEEAVSQNVMQVHTSAPARVITDDSITPLNDVAFRTVPYFNHPITLRMDLLIPSDSSPHPLVIFFPGGGFVMADRRASIVQRQTLARAGYVVASVEYRVGLGAQYPALVDDARAAIAFMREHSGEYGIDPTRIALMGNSAGGYVATMAALRENDVQAVIDLYGVADLDLIAKGLGDNVERAHHSPAATEAILVNGPAFGVNPGASVFDTPEKTAEASPTPYVTEAAPPFLIFHGSADTLVSPIGSMVLFEELRIAGAEAERYVINGAPHGGPMFDAPEVIGTIIAFLHRHL